MTADPQAVPQLIGRSAALKAVEAEIDVAARSDAKVLITGETGVGKEIVAHLIHARSVRRQKPLVTINCAGVPESLLESELFGHTKGSFTGAYRDRRGIFEQGANGTVFLDEIGEMSLRMQAALLRFLQSGELQRVGADRPHARVNVRLIAATNRDLKARVDAGEFREDFYFRLNVIGITIPPLRERREDIPLLAEHFLAEFARTAMLGSPRTVVTLAPDTLDVLQQYDWPGNVRELRNVIERLVARAHSPVIAPRELPDTLVAATRSANAVRMASAHRLDGGHAVRRIDSVDSSAGAHHTHGGAVDTNGVTGSAASHGAAAHGANGHGAGSPLAHGGALTSGASQEAARRMFEAGESFWAVVGPGMNAGTLTRDDLRRIVNIGLERTQGSYRSLVSLFNMHEEEHIRFLSFLREHDCHLPRHGLRTTRRSRSKAATAPAIDKA